MPVNLAVKLKSFSASLFCKGIFDISGIKVVLLPNIIEYRAILMRLIFSWLLERLQGLHDH